MEELVLENETGLLFEPGDALDLSAKVQYAIEHPQDLQIWGKQARSLFENEFTAHRAYDKLMDIYEEVLDSE